jgi:hypothetical protein
MSPPALSWLELSTTQLAIIVELAIAASMVLIATPRY